MATAGHHEDGRLLLAAFYTALRAFKLYPVENVTVQQALDELHNRVTRFVGAEGAVELRLVGDFVFLNETRLRLSLSNFSVVGGFALVLDSHGIGGLDIVPGVDRSEWIPFLACLARAPEGDDPYEAFENRLQAAPVEHIHTLPEREVEDEGVDEGEAIVAAKRTYAKSVQVAKEMFNDVRVGRAVNTRKVKRAVQGIVDQVLSDEPSIVTMTTLRDFDEYTFTHSVNVCIFSVIIGQRLGLKKQQLFELGLSALLHDVGKMRTDADLLNKTEGLTEEEWAELREHPVEGLLLLAKMPGFAEVPYRQMLTAYEHHMKTDLTGYPKNRRERQPGLYSRIVAVADGFDAGTSIRSYQYKPWPADQVLREMRDNPKRGFDPLLVKVLVNATGVYPIGTLVVLDTHELAVVCEVNTDPDFLHQPKIKVISDERGVPRTEPILVDLARPTPPKGQPRRAIVKTTDPQKYAIRVSDYLI